MSPTPTDVIDELVGITPGSALDANRNRRPETKANAQASYAALFNAGTEAFTLTERLAVAAFVTGLNAQPESHAHYAGLLAEADPKLAAIVANHVASSTTTGPYGNYPAEGPLAGESEDGVRLRVKDPELGARLSSALEHAHLLVFRPREAAREDLGRLLAAGWDTDGIVSLSQLVSFLNFQVRVVAGLRLLASTPTSTAKD
ncbi:CMD domain protein [Paeniglutamicibacter sp. NPDC091659]|uniref:CMD domain protein n=1 Tax=Paeniglutamicibacter sp. NPDC091659 TaxID=3364389 RepID=UPI00381AF928